MNNIEGDRRAADTDKVLRDATDGEYKYGFVTDIDTEIVPPGLNEDVIRLISAKKGDRKSVV